MVVKIQVVVEGCLVVIKILVVPHTAPCSSCLLVRDILLDDRVCWTRVRSDANELLERATSLCHHILLSIHSHHNSCTDIALRTVTFSYFPGVHEEFSLGYLLGDDWDELEEQFLLMIGVVMGQRKIKWKHSRLDWNEHVEKLLHEEEFDATYRMSLEAFTTLLDFLHPMITPNLIKALNSCDEPIYPEMVMAVGLRWLAGGSYSDIKNVYDISKNSVYRLKDIFLDAVLACNALEIRFPDTPEELENICKRFEAKSTNTVMRGCVGAMDGLFATIKQPPLLTARAIQEHTIIVNL
jgi:hypothetical protein